VSDYLSAPLGPDHEVGAFQCGKQSLDDWLRGQARRAQEAGTARTYIWTKPDSPDVLAYYSIAPTQVTKVDVPRSLSGGCSTIPGYLLARLALDASLHGQGLGAELLVDALGRIVEAAQAGGGRLIVVDALDEQAKAFYRRHDFIPVEGTMRLYLKVATARTALEL
jgi:GNAT superfamily N-acetyltransferase